MAGSVVLHRVLAREAGDIDIHHPTIEEMLSSFNRDAEILKYGGFSISEFTKTKNDIEGIFRSLSSVVTIHWSHTLDERLLPLERDIELGWRISVADAIFQKLLMIFDGDEGKHFADLADCANSDVLCERLVHAAALRRFPEDPASHVARIENGIRAAGGAIDGGSYSSISANTFPIAAKVL